MLTLTPWSPLPGGHQRHWRHDDGRDTIACRLIRISGAWRAYITAPNGAQHPAIIWPGATTKAAKGHAEIELDRIRREWEGAR